MTTLHDVDLLEGECEPVDEEEFYSAVQRAINCGLSWANGRGGRQAMDCITSGHCMLGQSGTRDGFGQPMPSRHDVQAGTKGSYEYVVKMRGPEWADMIAAV
jgi:hypothetical protein